MPTNNELAERIVADLGLMCPFEFETTVHHYADRARGYLQTPQQIVAERHEDGRRMTGHEAAYAIIAFLVALRHLYYGPAAPIDDLEAILA